MAVRLSVLRTGRALLPRNIIFLLLVLISVRLSKRQDLVQHEGLGTLKNNLFISSGLETTTFRLSAKK
jgi:hypothetical protein